ncbi:MAG: putative transposase [Desulfobacteraceae bacterium Eth-SRB1]|nr:MAG: putative transposase [Desulfobacteraceae bacterium Eth-SRB1]
MSRFRKLSQTLWHCQHHIIWCPKYRFRVLEGEIKKEVEKCVKTFSEVQKCELFELNVQIDRVHLLVMIPPKISISNYVGTVKGRTAIRVLNKFRKLKQKPYWGDHFWARGYCVNTVASGPEMVRKYIKYQEKQEKKVEKSRY